MRRKRTMEENLRIIRERQPELLDQMKEYAKIWPTLTKAERYRDWMYYRLVFKFKRRLDKRLEGMVENQKKEVF